MIYTPDTTILRTITARSRPLTQRLAGPRCAGAVPCRATGSRSRGWLFESWGGVSPWSPSFVGLWVSVYVLECLCSSTLDTHPLFLTDYKSVLASVPSWVSTTRYGEGQPWHDDLETAGTYPRSALRSESAPLHRLSGGTLPRRECACSLGYLRPAFPGAETCSSTSPARDCPPACTARSPNETTPTSLLAWFRTGRRRI